MSDEEHRKALKVTVETVDSAAKVESDWASLARSTLLPEGRVFAKTPRCRIKEPY
jgi:hypothetical protein